MIQLLGVPREERTLICLSLHVTVAQITRPMYTVTVDFEKWQTQHKCLGYCMPRLNLTELIRDMRGKYYSVFAPVVWIPVGYGERRMPTTLSSVGFGNYTVCWLRRSCSVTPYHLQEAILQTFTSLVAGPVCLSPEKHQRTVMHIIQVV